MRHRFEDDQEFRRDLHRQDGLLARRQLHRIEGDFLDDLLEVVGKVDPGTPEHLEVVLEDRKRIRIVCRDPAHAWRHGEGHLDHLVERGFVAGRTEGAFILFAMDRPECGIGVQHTTAARAEHIPGKIEHAEPRCMQERRDDSLLVEAEFRRESQHVDTAKFMVRSVLDQLLDCGHGVGIGRLPKYIEHGLGVAHA